jgi:hypothetical protein
LLFRKKGSLFGLLWRELMKFGSGMGSSPEKYERINMFAEAASELVLT